MLRYATHLTWKAGVVEMFSEVNTTWVEEFKVVIGCQGQTVTVGNSSSVMGWVVIVVDTGDSCHSL